jgi:hypothetical protein
MQFAERQFTDGTRRLVYVAEIVTEERHRLAEQMSGRHFMGWPTDS